MGVPVVSSDIAAGGVDAVPGEHMLTASDPQGYAEAVLTILEDRDERARLSQAGRARMESHHTWPNSMKKLDGLIEACLEGTKAKAA